MKRPPKYGSLEPELSNTLLVDGNALFKTSFYGAKNLYNKDGKHIGGLFQFLTTLRKILNLKKFNSVYVFWDGKYSGKLRYDMYPEYKQNRNKNYNEGTSPIDESMIIQKYQIQEYLEDLFIRQYEDEVVEVDDILAYYCKIKKEDENIVICTNDRDICQLLDKNVGIYFCDLKVIINTDNFDQYFNYHYKNAKLIKLLSGCNSDNIKGIRGLREKTLFKYFPELQNNEVSLDDVINKSIDLIAQRVSENKSPIKAIVNITKGISDGSNASDFFNITNKLVDLSNPLITEECKKNIDELIDAPIDPEDRNIKEVIKKMDRDGLKEHIDTYPDALITYLIPFKKLINSEIENNLN